MIPFICPSCGQFSIDSPECSCHGAARDTAASPKDSTH